MSFLMFKCLSCGKKMIRFKGPVDPCPDCSHLYMKGSDVEADEIKIDIPRKSLSEE